MKAAELLMLSKSELIELRKLINKELARRKKIINILN